MEENELNEWWKKGFYEPYGTDKAAELIALVKEFVPPWVRIMRVHREFPAQLIKAGVKSGNLRELAVRKLRERGKKCRCIRCREIGHRTLKEKIAVSPGEVQPLMLECEASDEKEVFISFEEPETDAMIA